MSVDLDVGLLSITELGRRGIRVPFHLGRNQLDEQTSQSKLRGSVTFGGILSRGCSYVGGHKDSQRTSFGKEAVLIHRDHDGIDLGMLSNARSDKALSRYPYRLALEGPPNNSPISDCELGQPISRQNTPLGNIECVHDGYDVVAPCACTLDVV